MTPATKALDKAGIKYRLHSYEHDKHNSAYGEEAVKKLGLSAEQVFKTLLVKLDGKALAVAVVPVARQLDLKAAATALKAKRAEMAPADEAQRATGYLLGGISPLGQKRRLPMVVDSSAERFDTLFVSGGRRGLEIELAPGDLLAISGADYASVAR